MKNYPLISIVILNYNGLRYLHKIIPPLLNLNYSNYEIVIVDNKSSDNSLKYLKKIKKQVKFKIIENSENCGYCIGKNIGVEKASGEYILLLDGDILIEDKELLGDVINLDLEDKIMTFVMVNKGYDNTKFYGGYFNFYGINQNKEIPLKMILNHKKEIFCGCPHGGAIFFKKKVWMNFFGGYDEIQPYMLDDNDLGMRAWINNLKCIVYNKSYLIHLGEPNMKDDNYYWKYKYYFSGFSTSMFKNYKLKRLVLNYPPFVFFAIVKTLKQFLRRRNFNVIKSFFWSIGFFIRNLPKILKKRKEIQLKEK